MSAPFYYDSWVQWSAASISNFQTVSVTAGESVDVDVDVQLSQQASCALKTGLKLHLQVITK